MIYRWAVFHHNHLHLGRAVNALVVMLAVASLIVGTVSEDIYLLGGALGLAMVCFCCFIVFAVSDRLRQSMH